MMPRYVFLSAWLICVKPSKCASTDSSVMSVLGCVVLQHNMQQA